MDRPSRGAGGEPPLAVLVIEHSPELQERLMALIEESPAVSSVAGAADAAEALDHLHRTEFDAVVLDVDGPGAVATLREVRRAALAARLVAVGADDTPELRATYEAAGADHFLPKWGDWDALMVLLRAPVR